MTETNTSSAAEPADHDYGQDNPPSTNDWFSCPPLPPEPIIGRPNPEPKD
jgi:hypothetical protein